MRIELRADYRSEVGTMNPGDRIEVPDSEAIRMIEAGEAVPVRDVQPDRAIGRKKAEKAS